MADSDGPPAKKAKKDAGKGAKAIPACPYGARCYRKNPAHFKEYSHPDEEDDEAGPSSTNIDTSKLPVCPYGSNCYRKNLLHYAEFSHPLTSDSTDDSNSSGSDTDVYEDEEEDTGKGKTKASNKTKALDKKKDNNMRSDSLSLVKSYSKMTEEERKELIRKAFEAKKALKKELEETKSSLAEKDKELKKLHEEVSTGLLLLDGEKEALEGDEVKYFPLYAERGFREGSADQAHFRLAESQFYRLISGTGQTYRVSKVEYIVNPELCKRFKEAREDIKFMRGEDMSLPVLAFHGTDIKNFEPIIENGFKVPGEKGFKHKTDTGYYGKGVYFSEYPAYSMSYIQGSLKLLLCQVLPGKVYNCTKLIHGKPLMKGYDSHISPCKKELIIFNSHHILPSYVVHYSIANVEFKYKKKPEEREAMWKSGDALSKLYMKAVKSAATAVFNGLVFHFFGDLCDSKFRLGQLVAKHGAYNENTFKGAMYTLMYYPQVIVCTKEVFDNQPAAMKKVKDKKANNATIQTHIVHEQFIYDSIKNKVRQELDDYYFD